MDQEQIDWGGFKSGTWWVYKEENLGIYDSIYIYKEMRKWLPGVSPAPNHYTEFYKSYFSSNRGIDSGYFYILSPRSGIQMFHFNDIIPEHSRSCYLVNPPPVQGEAINNGHVGQYVLFDTIFSTYKLGNFEFTNVVRANDNFNYFYLGTPTLIYSVKNIGIIRKEFPEYNQVWNLVDYHIEQ